MDRALKIMIVDDNAELRAFVRNLLSDLAEEICDYGDGASALAHYDQHRPDWTVVDIVMPGIDGLAVTSWIKSRYPNARVAVMTQNDNPKLKARAFQMGATVFVPKDDLLQLRSLMEKHSRVY